MVARDDSCRAVLVAGEPGIPRANSDVRHNELFPRDNASPNEPADRKFKDPWTKDGHHFREEPDSSEQNCYSMSGVRDRVMSRVEDKSERYTG